MGYLRWNFYMKIAFALYLFWRILEGATWTTFTGRQRTIYPLILIYAIGSLYCIIKEKKYKKQLWDLIADILYIIIFLLLCLLTII